METAQLTVLEPGVFRSLPGITAGFSTRHGGVSSAPFGSLNLGLSAGDERERVQENRRILFESVGFSAEQIAVAGQVHGTDVKEVTASGLFPGFDAMVTDRSGILLCISAADCAAVLLADAGARVVGACHSGWRGTVGRITVRTIEHMERLGARRERLHAYVSPCISAEHFEVGPEVAEQFDPAFVLRHPDQEKPYVDMKAAIQAQLHEAGILASNVEVSPHCTVAGTDTFFSYRAEAGRTGRMMGFIGLR